MVVRISCCFYTVIVEDSDDRGHIEDDKNQQSANQEGWYRLLGQAWQVPWKQQVISDQNHAYLLYRGDYTTQLYGDYIKPC